MFDQLFFDEKDLILIFKSITAEVDKEIVINRIVLTSSFL